MKKTGKERLREREKSQMRGRYWYGRDRHKERNIDRKKNRERLNETQTQRE